MITKESNTVRKCCLYASDFHLEMILLPYIKERINKSKFLIITQNDLSNTIKILLDRVNIEKTQKEEILKLNWKDCSIQGIQSMKEAINDNKEINIIVNGDWNYIEAINKELKIFNNVKIIDCFNIQDKKLNMDNIKKIYKEVLNTSKI